MKRLANIAKAPILFSIFLLLLWEGLVETGVVKRFILPSPTDIIKALFENMGELLPHTLVTAGEALMGLLLALVTAILLAVLMDSFSLLKEAIYPILVVSQTVPIIVLAPLIAMWFGFGILPKVFVVGLVCFFPVLISLLDGLYHVDKDAVNLFRSMGANKLQILRYLKWKGSLKSFYSGLRISATYSIMGAVIGEWLGGSKGLGVYMLRARHSFALDKVFAAILIIVLLSMGLFRLVMYVEKCTMPWRR